MQKSATNALLNTAVTKLKNRLYRFILLFMVKLQNLLNAPRKYTKKPYQPSTAQHSLVTRNDDGPHYRLYSIADAINTARP